MKGSTKASWASTSKIFKGCNLRVPANPINRKKSSKTYWSWRYDYWLPYLWFEIIRFNREFSKAQLKTEIAFMKAEEAKPSRPSRNCEEEESNGAIQSADDGERREKTHDTYNFFAVQKEQQMRYLQLFSPSAFRFFVYLYIYWRNTK